MLPKALKNCPNWKISPNLVTLVEMYEAEGLRLRLTNIWPLLEALVVTQMVERSLLTLEVPGSIPVIGKLYITYNLSAVLKR